MGTEYLAPDNVTSLAKERRDAIAALETQLQEAQDELKKKDADAAKERARLQGLLKVLFENASLERERTLLERQIRDENEPLHSETQTEIEWLRAEVAAWREDLRKELAEAKADLKAERSRGLFKRLFGG